MLTADPLAPPELSRFTSPMRILILGGAEFLGRALVDAALARGAEVTLVNRGTHPSLPGTTSLVADRRDHAAFERALASVDTRWDAVIDTWSWEPYVVRETARLLEPQADRYLYISSRSVYADPAPGADETAPLVDASPDDGDPVLGDAAEVDYPQAKAGAELAVLERFGERAFLIRPGVILGPHENIGRLPWWLNRMAGGGDVLAPGRPDDGIQFIDSRDLAEWTLHLATGSAAPGAYDAVSPVGLHTMGSLLDACVRVAGSPDRPPTLRWTADDVVLGAGIEPWIELPLWLPAGELHDALHGSDVSKAVAAGLTYRSPVDTASDTWTWLQSVGGEVPQREDRPALGLAADKEARALGQSTV